MRGDGFYRNKPGKRISILSSFSLEDVQLRTYVIRARTERN